MNGNLALKKQLEEKMCFVMGFVYFISIYCWYCVYVYFLVCRLFNQLTSVWCKIKNDLVTLTTNALNQWSYVWLLTVRNIIEQIHREIERGKYRANKAKLRENWEYLWFLFFALYASCHWQPATHDASDGFVKSVKKRVILCFIHFKLKSSQSYCAIITIGFCTSGGSILVHVFYLIFPFRSRECSLLFGKEDIAKRPKKNSYKPNKFAFSFFFSHSMVQKHLPFIWLEKKRDTIWAILIVMVCVR